MENLSLPLLGIIKIYFEIEFLTNPDRSPLPQGMCREGMNVG
jgi:hypothetical protein